MDIKVTSTEETSVEIIADSIQKIADAFAKVEQSRLTRRALVALIHDHSGVPKRDINIVLNNLADLAKDWLKPKTKNTAVT